MQTTSVFPPSTEKLHSQYLNDRKSGFYDVGIYRDMFDMRTVMLFGATTQLIWALVFSNRIIIAVAPALLLGAHKLFSLWTRWRLFKVGQYAPFQIKKAVTPVIPREDGEGRSDITAIILSAASHHPMGVFAPGFKELGEMFNSYADILDANREEYDYLGGTAWQGMTAKTGNNFMAIHYFRTPEGLSKFSLKGAHAQAMSWWAKNEADLKHISISHELFTAPANNWEAIYLNERPLGLGATSFKMPDGTYRSPLVDISKNHLSSQKRRSMEADLIKDDF